MTTQQNVVKTLLQLIGISSLFIAAKLEVSISSLNKDVNGQTAHLLHFLYIVYWLYIEFVAMTFQLEDKKYFVFKIIIFRSG